MQTNETENMIWLVAILSILGVLLLGVPFVTNSVYGLNITNSTSISKVYVWNTEPNITTVEVSPTNIDLTAGNTTTVSCTAFVFDYNGWEDVTNVSARFYHMNHGDDLNVTDNNYRYHNTSCGPCQDADGSGTNASCTCQFDVQYYADAGLWQCNITVGDDGGNATERVHNFNDTENSSTVVINTVLGIRSPDEIDFGNLSVTETSNETIANITNWGNVPINVSLRGWGGDNESLAGVGNWSMNCELGNISINRTRYSLDPGVGWGDMQNLTFNETDLYGFHIPARQNDTADANATNQTYWALKVPLSVGGYCNGSLQFIASEAEVI